MNLSFDRSCILQTLAAQFVYLSTWKELIQQGVTKDSKCVVLHSIGLSRMELRIFYKEQVAFYLHLGMTNVRVEAKNPVSEEFLKKFESMSGLMFSLGDEGRVKEYSEIAVYISELVGKRKVYVCLFKIPYRFVLL